MSIIANKPSATVKSLSRLLDVPTRQIEPFLDTFRAVPQAREINETLTNKSELFDFYKGWLPNLVSELSSEDFFSIMSDCYVAFENLGSDDFTNLLLALDPKQFNKLTKAIAAV